MIDRHKNKQPTVAPRRERRLDTISRANAFVDLLELFLVFAFSSSSCVDTKIEGGTNPPKKASGK